MAGTQELDSFLRKFVILWQSGCDAKLDIESKAGNAYVTLRVGLGKVLPGQHHGHVGHTEEVAQLDNDEEKEEI